MAKKKKKVNQPEPDRQSKDIPREIDLLKPIDIFKLGTDEDPCFGKLFSLTHPTCRRCGDNELCQAVMAQNLHKTRKEIEDKHAFKDLEQPYEDPKEMHFEMKRWMTKKISMGVAESTIIRRAVKRYDVTKGEAKRVYIQLNK